jgi:hypothetical protein
MNPAKRTVISVPPLVASGVLPPLSTLNTVRRRGRPKGSLNKPKKKPVQKAHDTLQKVVQDVALLSEPAFDGGGTQETAPGINKESLERRVARRLNVLDRYLTDQRLTELLSISGLKEIGIYEGIMMDKAMVLKGQPTVIVGSADRNNLESVLPKLLNEMRRRKLITSVRERRIDFTETNEAEPKSGSLAAE